MRLMKGYLNVDPASYDQLLRDASQPFFDYLNIKYVYVPPGQALHDRRLVEVYRGSDGVLLQNTGVLPRYFLVRHFTVQPSFDKTVWFSRYIRDFAADAMVDRVPEQVLRAAPGLSHPGVLLRRGEVRIGRYSDNATQLEVTSNGWNLLVSSDVHWPGWRVYWNGIRQPPVIVNGAFLGCFVPPGKGQLELRYWPDEFTRGLCAAGAGIALLVMLMMALGVKKHRAHDGGSKDRTRSGTETIGDRSSNLGSTDRGQVFESRKRDRGMIGERSFEWGTVTRGQDSHMGDRSLNLGTGRIASGEHG
jgi:hypothetical protein